MSAMTPLTKGARHQRIIDLVTSRPVRSQTELADLLAGLGVRVTQATLSRDLVELDAVKVRGADGALVYAVPGEGGDRTPTAPRDSAAGRDRLARLCAELLVSAEASAATAGRTGLVATMMMPIRGVLGRITQEMRLRYDERLLAEMDDVQLSDIGIVRTQIADAVRTGRVSPWLDRRGS